MARRNTPQINWKTWGGKTKSATKGASFLCWFLHYSTEYVSLAAPNLPAQTFVGLWTFQFNVLRLIRNGTAVAILRAPEATWLPPEPHTQLEPTQTFVMRWMLAMADACIQRLLNLRAWRSCHIRTGSCDKLVIQEVICPRTDSQATLRAVSEPRWSSDSLVCFLFHSDFLRYHI